MQDLCLTMCYHEDGAFWFEVYSNIIIQMLQKYIVEYIVSHNLFLNTM